MRLILASASPRRAELLRAAGYVFETMPVDVDERVRPGEPPEDYVRRLAMEKSACAWDAATDVVSGFSRTSAGPPEGGHYVILARLQHLLGEQTVKTIQVRSRS